MNVLTKTLLFSLVLSLMPLVSKVVAPDYQGFNLEAAEDNKKKKRKRIKLPSKKAQRILQEVQPLLESESWDEALAMLSVIETDPKFTGTDIARMLWYYGYIYFSQEKCLLLMGTTLRGSVGKAKEATGNHSKRMHIRATPQ